MSSSIVDHRAKNTFRLATFTVTIVILVGLAVTALLFIYKPECEVLLRQSIDELKEKISRVLTRMDLLFPPDSPPTETSTLINVEVTTTTLESIPLKDESRVARLLIELLNKTNTLLETFSSRQETHLETLLNDYEMQRRLLNQTSNILMQALVSKDSFETRKKIKQNLGIFRQYTIRGKFEFCRAFFLKEEN